VLPARPRPIPSDTNSERLALTSKRTKKSRKIPLIQGSQSLPLLDSDIPAKSVSEEVLELPAECHCGLIAAKPAAPSSQNLPVAG
jgi:hypothetical protein